MLRTMIAFLTAVIAAYLFASVFYTYQVIGAQAAIGATYTPAQQAETYAANLIGLWQYGAMIAVAFVIAFLVAAGARRVLKPLAPVAYPVAGAASILVLLYAVEAQLGGGAGVIGGARTATGLALQCLAGAIGGFVFALMRPQGR
ncbi:MAG: hypothetical protein AAFW81_12800 [Pseudomonadota bacterium]